MKKITLLLYIIGLSAITYWAYPIITERYFSDDSKNSEELISSQNNCADDGTCEINLEDTSVIEEDRIDEDSKENKSTDNTFLEINHSDCNSKCQHFEIEKEKNYCLQACGLNTATTPITNGCETLSDLEKDYCWKNEAVEKTDFSICKKIEDSKIKEVCQNRVTEDIIDSQKIEN